MHAVNDQMGIEPDAEEVTENPTLRALHKEAISACTEC
jgi:hypothetical protein